MGTTTLDDQQLLSQLERAIRVASKSLYVPHRAKGTAGDVSIDRSGYAVLGALDDGGETRLSDVACVLALDLSTVSRQVKVLEEHGFVQRRPDPDDRRASLLDLSPQGRRELARMRAVRVDTLTAATATWSTEDRSRLLQLLERLATDLSPETAL